MVLIPYLNGVHLTLKMNVYFKMDISITNTRPPHYFSCYLQI